MSPAATVSDRSPSAADLGLAVVVAVLTTIGFGVSVADDIPFLVVDGDAQPPLPASQALLEGVAEALPLTFRRMAPVTVFGLVAVVSLVDEALNRRPEPLPLAVLVALFTLAVLRRPVVAGVAATVFAVGLAAEAATAWTDVSDDQLYIDLLTIVGTVMLGYWIRLDRARTRGAERRALEVSLAAEGRTREAVEEERARIAREMHDVLGHQLSVIVAQAATARRVYADRPQATADTLGSIESVGRDALSGLRRLVGLLRVERGRPDPAPPPGLDRLGVLVEQVRRAGLAVTLVEVGDRRPLPPEVELNAFRVVQEALTNSIRHGGRTAVTVTVTYRKDALGIDVRDAGADDHPGPAPGTGDPADGTALGGYGLIGMRQRLELLGGELVAGPDGGRGFRVTARLPAAEGLG
jgi:signal transduction histidine kinase